MSGDVLLKVAVQDDASKVLRDIGSSLGTIGRLAGVAFGIKEISQALNLYQGYNNRIRNATTSLQQFTVVQSALNNISLKNNSTLSNTADLFARLALTTAEYNLTETERIQLTDTLTASFKKNGVSAQDASSVIDNLGKSFLKGNIDARDFNQILNTAPDILQRFASEAGLTVPQLQKLAQEGKLSAAALIQALQNTAAATAATAKTQEVTLGQSLTNLGTSFVLTIGRINDATGLTKGLAIVFDGLGKNIDIVAISLGTFFTVVTISKIGGIAGAVSLLTKGFIALRVAILAIPGVGIALALTAAATAAYALYENFQKVETAAGGAEDNFMDFLKTGQAVNPVLEGSVSNAEKFLSRLKNSLETNERLKEIESARLQLGKEYTAEVQQQHEALLDIQKTREIEKALPALISETQGAYAGGSKEQKELEEKLKLNDAAREINRISEEQHQSNMLILMEQYAIKKRQSQQQSIADMAKDALAGNMSLEKLAQLDSDSKIAVGKEMFGTLLADASKYSEKAFKANKALALANAIMKGFEAIQSSYAAGAAIGGPILGAIFAGLSAIATRGQINAIRSTQYTGARRQGGLVGENQSYLVGESGPEMFTPSSSGRITPNDQMSRAVTVNFNISTVDADGFDEILINRRSTIVGIINEATNKRGRVGATQ